MFDDLIESMPQRGRTAREVMVSGIVHGVLITGAVLVSQAAAEPPQAVVEDTASFVLIPTRVPEAALPSALAARVAAPSGFETVVAPQSVPINIPPVNLSDRFDAARYTAQGREGGEPDTVRRLSVVRDLVTRESYTFDQVDEPAAYLNGPKPVYPAVLKSSGITGTVTLEFIVGVDGKIETGSIHVVASTAAAFEASAIEAVQLSRFKSAKIRGQTVRQLVRQAVRFGIDQ